jgi:hypothetical protein
VATHSHWQLLQLAPTATPGEFKLWALADTALYCIPLRVQRQVVVNSDRPGLDQDGGGVVSLAQLKPTKMLLPPGDMARHLYEVSSGLSM